MMEPRKKTQKAWIVVDAVKAGSFTQCLALCQYMGWSVEHILKIDLPFPYRWLSPFFRLGILKATGVNLKNDLPDVVVGSGRQSSGVVAAFKGKVKTIFMMDPYIPLSYFDAVIAPRHDHLTGENLCLILGSLCFLDPKDLNAQKQKFFPDLPGPVITVLIGGDSQHFSYTSQTLQDLYGGIRDLQKKTGAKKILMTASRRTRPDIFRELKALFSNLDAYVWDFEGENPYRGMLGAADLLVATSDSIAMMSEACSLGKPVFIQDLKISHPKFQSFLSNIFQEGYALPLQDIPQKYKKLSQGKSLQNLKEVQEFLKHRGF